MSNDTILNKLFKDYKVFIDTCTLMHENQQAVEHLFEKIALFSQKYANQLIIPVRVIEELEMHSRSKELDKSSKAKSALNILKRHENCYKKKGEECDDFADSVFLKVFPQHRFRYNLALLTQDYKLSVDILNIKKQGSVRCDKSIKVYKLNGDNGKLIDFEDYVKNQNASQASDSKKHSDFVPSKPKKPNKAFTKYSQVTQIPDTIVQVRTIPGENSSVNVSRGQIYLRKEIARGGEGVIYETDTPYIAKIYKKELLTKRRIEKIKLIISKQLKYNGICFPEEALYNQYGEFVGYLMPRAPGKEIQKCLFIKALLEKHFPNWNKLDLVKLSLTILDKIKYLHDHGIIMGDINPLNILVASPEEVYFIDTDSYQIDDFPCPVGTVNFTAPEIQRKHFGDFLRTIGNENFAVATLLFMLMLPGKPPYSQQGGADPISNIINMDFSYPLGESKNGKTPEGPWRYIWSHLLFKVKEAFYETFKKGGKYSTEKTRLNVYDWIRLFEGYKYAIESGNMGSKDPMSLTLFPTRFKAFVNENGETIIKKNKNSSVLDTRKCQKCGREFNITAQILQDCKLRGQKLPVLCDYCSSGVAQTITCIDCGKSFDLTNKEYQYFKDKGLTIPKRCTECRGKKRSRSVTSIPVTGTNSQNKNKGGPDKKSGFFGSLLGFFNH